MICFESSIVIKTLPGTVKAIYLDYQHWDKTFPLTITAASLIKAEGDTLWIRVQHKTEGIITNELVLEQPNTVILKEWKPKYSAVFVNHFSANGDNTEYRVEAFVYLQGFFLLLKPLVRWIAEHRLKSYVLTPLKKACEELVNKNRKTF